MPASRSASACLPALKAQALQVCLDRSHATDDGQGAVTPDIMVHMQVTCDADRSADKTAIEESANLMEKAAQQKHAAELKKRGVEHLTGQVASLPFSVELFAAFCLPLVSILAWCAED